MNVFNIPNTTRFNVKIGNARFSSRPAQFSLVAKVFPRSRCIILFTVPSIDVPLLCARMFFYNHKIPHYLCKRILLNISNLNTKH